MAECVFLNAATVTSVLQISSLHDHLNTFLPSASSSVTAPLRHHYPINPISSLLLMPSLSSTKTLPYLGVKIVTSFPTNSKEQSLPGVHATYSLFSSSTGVPLASIDGTSLTLIRTAAVSALAARYLARVDARTLLVVGAGALSPHLVRAHLFVRPKIERVIVWNRTVGKAVELVEKLAVETQDVVFEHAESLDEVVGLGDVVVCATSSENAMVKGRLLKQGAHLNLLGSFTPVMRECDDDAVVRGRVFVDCEGAMEEAGELVGAFERGVMSAGDVSGSLVDLVGGGKAGRRSEEEVTVFKSVGSAVFDLLAAQLAYENFMKGKINSSCS